MVCEIHGRQNFHEVCEHIWQALEDGIIPEMEELPIYSTKLCAKCYSDHNVKQLVRLTTEEFIKLPVDEQIEIKHIVNTVYKGITRKA